MAEVVRTVPSASGEYRAQILRHADGVFRVEVEQWREEWVPGEGKVDEGWSRVTRGATFADTADRAAELAEESLRLAESLDGG